MCQTRPVKAPLRLQTFNQLRDRAISGVTPCKPDPNITMAIMTSRKIDPVRARRFFRLGLTGLTPKY